MTLEIREPRRQRLAASQLLYDTRYRRITIQVIALALLAAGIWWLGAQPLDQHVGAGGGTSTSPSSGGAPAMTSASASSPYTSDDTHARAALVGILNTLLVSGLGIVLATIIGVLAGVLRLSKNWLVARLMTAFVEAFRNIPLLLWIVLVYAILSESTPAPAAFRPGPDGTEPQAEMLFGLIAFTNRGTYIPWPVWGEGAEWLGLVVLLSIGAVFAYRAWARRRQAETGQPPADPVGLSRDPAGASPSGLRPAGPAAVLRCPRRARNRHRPLRRRDQCAQLARGAVARPRALHRGLHRRDRARRHPGRVEGADRSRLCAGPATGADHAPGHPCRRRCASSCRR